MRECEEISKVCNSRESCDWIARLSHNWQVTRMACVEHAGVAEGSRQLEHYRKKLPVCPDS